MVEEMFCISDENKTLYMYEQLRPLDGQLGDRLYIVRSIFDHGQRVEIISSETFNELKPKIPRNMIRNQ